MDTTSASELLFSNRVLEERDGGVSLSASFESSVAEHRATIDDLSKEELSGVIRDRVDERTAVEALVRLDERDPRLIAELLALYDHLGTPTDADRLTLLPVLRLFRSETVPTDGVPDPFIPVPGDQLPEFSRLYSRLFVYIWLDDCDPCDALKPRLESIFDRPREVMLFAVYGPEYKQALARDYDVTAGPAMLFLRDGTVDTRLYGAHSESTIEAELGKLRE